MQQTRPRTTQHATISLEHAYDASPKRVFNAWASAQAKSQWFDGPDGWERQAYSLDFRVGGREHNSGSPPGGKRHVYDAEYLEIVPNERIVFAYTMDLEQRRVTASLVTIELKAAGAGTKLTLTEQGAYFDCEDLPDWAPPSRQNGWGNLLKSLDEALR